MDLKSFAFYILSSLLLVFAIFVVSSRHLFRSAIYLMFALLMVAGLYFLISFYFLAAMQLLIYVGGIIVLIIFAILLTQSAGELLQKPEPAQKYISLAVSIAGFFLISFILLQNHSHDVVANTVNSEMLTIGKYLFEIKSYGYVLSFEIVGVLLLAVLIGSIVISLNTNQNKI